MKIVFMSTKKKQIIGKKTFTKISIIFLSIAPKSHPATCKRAGSAGLDPAGLWFLRVHGLPRSGSGGSNSEGLAQIRARTTVQIYTVRSGPRSCPGRVYFWLKLNCAGLVRSGSGSSRFGPDLIRSGSIWSTG